MKNQNAQQIATLTKSLSGYGKWLLHVRLLETEDDYEYATSTYTTDSMLIDRLNSDNEELKNLATIESIELVLDNDQFTYESVAEEFNQQYGSVFYVNYF